MEMKESNMKPEQGVSVQTAVPDCHSKHLTHVRVDVWPEREVEAFLLSARCSLLVEIKAALILWYLEGPSLI